METLFALLFKYRPFFFSRGAFTFQWAPPGWAWPVLLAATAGLALVAYRRREWRTHRLPLLLRGALLLWLLLLLMGPSLVISRLVTKENFLALLVDNSRSMGIPDSDQPRGEPLKALLARTSPLVVRLEAAFHLRFFQFGGRVRAMKSAESLDWQEEQTNVAAALAQVSRQTRNLPLAGIVLISDGSDNGHGDLEPVLDELKTRRVPVHTVGLGPAKIEPDLEMSEVVAPRRVIPGTLSAARVTVRQHGFGGSLVRLEVLEGKSLVRTQEIRLPRDSEWLTVEVPFTPDQEGVAIYTFRLRPLRGERLRQNNSRTTLVESRNPQARLLYVEGHPRWEFKFIRRALSGDRSIRLETLLRTAINKFYRQGIEEETTLSTGFPTTREALFAYRGLILGSVESSFFTYPQMEMIRDFVGKRGGGFLMLGGRTSFAAGKYRGTPIEEILPVWLGTPSEKDGSGYRQQMGRLRPTRQGEHHPALQLTLERKQNLREWARLPPLGDWNRVRSSKPGATLLAEMEPASTINGERHPLLLFQRYGRGPALAFLSGSSWRWRMLEPHQEQHHKMFWRQLVHWLIHSAQGPVEVETEREVYSPTQSVAIRAEVRDSSFNSVNDARVEATITAPDGRESTIPLEWDPREEGIYRAQWQARMEGLYLVHVEAQSPSLEGSAKSKGASSYFLSSTGEEYFDAAQKRDFLERLARETGGNYYTLDSIEHLPEEILYTPSRTSVVEVLDLWDMPINFLILASLLAAEWVWRRRRGLV